MRHGWPGVALLVATVAMPAVVRPALSAECKVVADFARNALGEFPADWKPREDRAHQIYRVLEEGGVRFVRATADGTGLQMGKELEWDLGSHPVLAWKWRPRAFPTGADERQSGRNDSVLGVYAVFPQTPASVKTVKYVWSAAASPGTTASASKGLTRMIVLRSGPPAGTGWVEEAVHVARDYERLFREPPKRPRGIAVLTDADDTNSRAVGDYAAFRLCPASR